MIIDILGPVVSIALIAIACVMHPVRHITRAQCPPTMFVNGIRPSGFFQCLPKPGGDPDDDGIIGHPDLAADPDGELYGRLWCTGGSHPIIVDSRTVGCQR